MMSATVKRNLICTLLAAGLAVLFMTQGGEITSHDLTALWNAGQAFHGGQFDAVYAGSDRFFTMEPPQPWMDAALASGRDQAVYPFIYPPIWAWLMGHVTQTIGFETFTLAATLVNASLLLACLALAYRIARPAAGPVSFLAAAFVLLSTSYVFLLAMTENQPHILVAALVLLAVERSFAGAPRTAGFALALAASIKLFPILFAIIWLAEGRRREVAATLIAGAILGLASIAVAGWPLHAAFLKEISAISNTVFFSFATFTLDSAVALFTVEAQMSEFDTFATGGSTTWLAMEKPLWWRGISTSLLIAVLAGFWVAGRRKWSQHAYFWPAAFIALSLVSPLSWVYHYIPAFCFLPAILVDAKTWKARLAPFIVMVPTSVYFVATTIPFNEFGYALVPAAVAGLIFGAIFFAKQVPSLSSSSAAQPGIEETRAELARAA